MSRIPFLGVIAIGATLLVAPSAYAMPLGAAHIGRSAPTGDGPGHARKPRCAHNGISSNKAGHLNCRRAKATTTGDAAPATVSSGDTNPGGSDTGTSTSNQSDQGSSGTDQGDQNDQGDQGSSGDQAGGSGDQGNQNSDN